MGPIIILDKSALQALSTDNLVLFHKYYMPNIVPILTLEILADLKKQSPVGKTEINVVQTLAKKILPHDTAYNTFHQELLWGSILGYPVQMDGRPILGGGRHVLTKEGKKGIIFKQTPEEIALRRWREGNFNEAEQALAERWREATRKQDLKALKENLERFFGQIPKFTNIREIFKYLDYLFELEANQASILTLFIYQFGFDNKGPEIFSKWQQSGSPQLKNFSPYAMYCLKIALLCEIGMICHVLGTRKTNHVDLMYFYYLPFCQAFCSGDKFHIELAALFLESKQYLITLEELKNDLALISQLSKLPDGTNKDIDFNILSNKGSITYKIWKERMRFLPGSPESKLKRNDEKKINGMKRSSEELTKHIKEEKDSEDTEEVFSVDEADFVIRENTINTTDFCLCGSGKFFGECCYKKVSKS